MSIDFVRELRIIRIGDHHQRFGDEINKHFDTYFNAVEKTTQGNLLIADFSAPSIHRYLHNGMEFSLSFLPEEPEVIHSYFRHRPEETRLAFDIGAYCGLSTYELSQRFEKVIAFEPDKLNRACLWENIARHQMNNVEVVPMAIMGATGRISFLSEGTPGSAACLAGRVAGPSVEVSAWSLKDAFGVFGVPDFMCMDIEEAEVEVLDAARTVLSKNAISIVVDSSHGVPITAPAVETILRECGYNAETKLIEGLATTWGWK